MGKTENSNNNFEPMSRREFFGVAAAGLTVGMAALSGCSENQDGRNIDSQPDTDAGLANDTDTPSSPEIFRSGPELPAGCEWITLMDESHQKYIPGLRIAVPTENVQMNTGEVHPKNIMHIAVDEDMESPGGYALVYISQPTRFSVGAKPPYDSIEGVNNVVRTMREDGRFEALVFTDIKDVDNGCFKGFLATTDTNDINSRQMFFVYEADPKYGFDPEHDVCAAVAGTVMSYDPVGMEIGTARLAELMCSINVSK